MADHGAEIDTLVREIRVDGVELSRSRAAVLLIKISAKDLAISREEFRKSVTLMNELGYDTQRLAAFCGISHMNVERWELGTTAAQDFARGSVLAGFAKGLLSELKI